MVVNHIDKTFVTSDAATILRQVLSHLFSWKFSTLLLRCLSLPAKCKMKNAEMLLTSPSPWLENCSAMLKISSEWVFIPLRLSVDTNKLQKKLFHCSMKKDQLHIKQKIQGTNSKLQEHSTPLFLQKSLTMLHFSLSQSQRHVSTVPLTQQETLISITSELFRFLVLQSMIQPI